MKRVLFPGSLDPITYGHMDVVEQALKIYDEVLICPLGNFKKTNGLFTLKERVELIQKIYEYERRVKVIFVDKKIAAVDIALDHRCETIVKGLRNVTDFADEIEQAKLNLEISNGKINTVALFASPSKTIISSSLVKELYELGKNISPYVHPIVEEAIKNKYKE